MTHPTEPEPEFVKDLRLFVSVALGNGIAVSKDTLKQTFAHIDSLTTRLSAAQAEIERLRGVLEWYGEEENHTVRYASEPETRMRQDRGQRARAALAAKREGRGDE